MKVLGFWAKLFTKCVAAVDYQTLSDTVEDLNKNVGLKEKVISDLKDEIGSKVERIKDLVQQVNNADQKVNDSTAAYDSLVNELTNTKDKLDVTLRLLSDSEGELKITKQQLENRPVVTEVCECGETDSEEVVPGDTKEEATEVTDAPKEDCKEEVPTSDETIGDGTFEKEDVLKGADVVVTSADKLQNFVNGLSRVQMKELKDDILKGHKNDKRLTSTLKNWIKKFPDKLETQVYFMFKSALTRRRGKQQLNAWYIKYDNM